MGMRYKCKDCTERIGFDLCGECYNNRSKLPGRFNQQHTSDHRMELDNTRLYGGLIAQLSLIGAGLSTIYIKSKTKKKDEDAGIISMPHLHLCLTFDDTINRILL
jgi:hypothetical protein